MSLFNNFTLVGRITNDLVIKEVRGGFKNVRINLLNEKENKKTGKKDKFFISCTLWEGDAVKAANILKKDSVILVSGDLKYEKWTDPATNEEKSTYVIDVREWISLEEVIAKMPMAEQKEFTPKLKPVVTNTNTSQRSTFDDGAPLKEPPMDEELPF